jgi:hypothetical protein
MAVVTPPPSRPRARLREQDGDADDGSDERAGQDPDLGRHLQFLRGERQSGDEQRHGEPDPAQRAGAKDMVHPHARRQSSRPNASGAPCHRGDSTDLACHQSGLAGAIAALADEDDVGGNWDGPVATRLTAAGQGEEQHCGDDHAAESGEGG